jgi:hypothetical protein
MNRNKHTALIKHDIVQAINFEEREAKEKKLMADFNKMLQEKAAASAAAAADR